MVAVSSCNLEPSVSTVVLYVLAAGVVAACAFLLLLLLFSSLFICLGAPGGSPPGFPSEAVGSLLFGLCRGSGWLSGLSLFSFYFFPVSFSLLSLFPCVPVRFGTITYKVL